MDFEEKTRVYLDTSVISHLDHPDSGEKYEITHRFWGEAKTGKYDIFISDLVLAEVQMCKTEKRRLLVSYLNDIEYSVLSQTENVLSLADEIINRGILTKKSYEDCQHIAYAATNNMDYLLSWNMKHLSNNKTNKGIKELNFDNKWGLILITTPEILMKMEVEENAEDFR